MSLVKTFGAVDGTISIKTHLKGSFGFSRILDLAFLFIEEIWHDVQKGYGSILSSISFQILAVSPDNNYLVDLWPNLWCNNYLKQSSKMVIYFSLTFPWFPPKMHVSFVHYVSKLLRYSPLLQSILCKNICEKTSISWIHYCND